MAAPANWGPHLWKSIHYIALGFPVKPSATDKANYKAFFMNLPEVLPCFSCAQNYKRHLGEIPPIDDFMESSNRLFEWTWRLHNVVNKDLGKKQISLENAKALYTHRVMTQDEKDNRFIMAWVIIGLIFVVGLVMWLTWGRKQR